MMSHLARGGVIRGTRTLWLFIASDVLFANGHGVHGA